MTTAPHTDTAAFARAWEEWHTAKDRALGDPHGFLAVTGLHWLDAEPARFPDAPGAWSTGPDGVVVELDEGEELLLDGVALHGRHAFGPIAERDSVYVTAGDALVEVARRGGRDLVRPRHPDHPPVREFTGTPAYPADPRWALTGRYLPFEAPRPVTVGAAVEGLRHVYDAPGEVEFELPDGSTHRLTAFNGHLPGTLQVLFTDATSGVTTYAANRSLSIPAPDADDRVTLDFNRAVNLPCAYTDLATCPLPPAENRLPAPVEAGELIPYERAGRP
ncbi:DUF1684 domain-containing protein [Kitasatospora sp. NPDC088134]|uniref:DUF1684 domain-containing protein n=1 Tax=Kitasatospora sp. NPDC088134 TaxID=3364071 RepID=UPI00380F2FDC